MRTEERVEELEDYLFEAINKKEKKLVRRFVISFIDHQDRDINNIAHSIELLAQQMASFQREMNARFEAVDKRFEAMQREMNARFEAIQIEMNARFEAIQREMNARFVAVDKRFEAMDKRFTTLTWFMGACFTFISVLIILSHFLK